DDSKTARTTYYLWLSCARRRAPRSHVVGLARRRRGTDDQELRNQERPRSKDPRCEDPLGPVRHAGREPTRRALGALRLCAPRLPRFLPFLPPAVRGPDHVRG